VEWRDVGAATVSRVAEIFKEHQPLTWYYMVSIAQGPSHKSSNIVQKRRPAEMVRDFRSTRMKTISRENTGCNTYHFHT
jgi:hypothetical protein